MTARGDTEAPAACEQPDLAAFRSGFAEARSAESPFGNPIVEIARASILEHPLYQREAAHARRLWRWQHGGILALAGVSAYGLHGAGFDVWWVGLVVDAAVFLLLLLCEVEALRRLGRMRRDGWFADLILTEYAPATTLRAFTRAHRLGLRPALSLAVGALIVLGAFISTVGFPALILAFAVMLILVPVLVLALIHMRRRRRRGWVVLSIQGTFTPLYLVEHASEVTIVAALAVTVAVALAVTLPAAGIPLVTQGPFFLWFYVTVRCSPRFTTASPLAQVNERFRAFALGQRYEPPEEA